MAGETTVILCSAHNRRVTSGPTGVLVHISGNAEPYCSSARFTVRREQEAGRAEVVALLTYPAGEEAGDEHT